MSDLFEDMLFRTFESAGEDAPAPEPDFTRRVLDRRRRRRQLRALRLTGAAALSLSVIAGVALSLPLSGGGPASYAQAADLGQARFAEDVWPAAVLRLPSTLADGRTYEAVRPWDAGRIIVAPMSGPAGYYPPEIMSIRTGQTAVLTPLTKGPGVSEYSFTGMMLGEHDLSWTMRGLRAGAAFLEVWSLPLAGGPPTKVATVDDQSLLHGLVTNTAFETGGTTYLYLATLDSLSSVPDVQRSQIYRIGPGGSLTAVAGVAGDTPVGGPWLREDGGVHTVRPPSASPGGKTWPGPKSPSSPPSFVNLVTGERRAAVQLPGRGVPVCDPDRCVAQNGRTLVAYRYDGTGRITATGATDAFQLEQPYGRFDAIRVFDGSEPFEGKQHLYLWDLEKNVVGIVRGDVVPTGDMPQLADDGHHKVVLDLDRIR